MNIEKEQITNELFKKNMNIDVLLDKMNEYKKQFPYDVDMYLLEGEAYIIQKNVPKAENMLLFCLKHYPYNVDTYFLLGEMFLLKKEYCLAVRYFSIAKLMNKYIRQNSIFFSKELCGQRMLEAAQIINDIVSSNHPDQIHHLAEDIKILNDQLKYELDIFGTILSNTFNYIGESLFMQKDGMRFCGYANALDFHNHPDPVRYDLVDFKGELLKIYYQGNKYSLVTDDKILLPIASKEPSNMISFQFDSGKKIIARLNERNAFSYYCVAENSEITSSHKMIIGEPVILKHAASRKRLVISFFVDGLSQKLLCEEGLENIMPNTFRFFSKGLICNNFFTTSDWTYPSLASLVSGVSLPEHMMFHPKVNKKLPEDRKILFEYLKEAGYYTARINGDWRSCATYGYTRGIDRYIAQHANHYKDSYPIIDAIEHMETFKETDQYLWLEYNDLHHIADDFDLTVLLQSKLDLSLQEAENRNITSVKQKSSLLKRKRYVEALKIADFRFQILYDYVERNYSDDEYIITMFGDHGQTYLLKPGEHHLSRYHSNAAFMVRGGGYEGICQEYMSAVDYPHILCRLANVKDDIYNTEGNLPKVFGGKEERKYTITETIHPNDPYQASIHAKDHVFYLTTENKVTEYGRLDSGKYHAGLFDISGTSLDNPELTDFYIKLIKERLKYILNY